jgi:predicted nucleic acid-binding Zn ribbon protein
MIIRIFIYVSCILLFVGAGLFYIVMNDRSRRDGRVFSGKPTKVTDTDKKRLKIAAILFFLGLLIAVILKLTVCKNTC